MITWIKSLAIRLSYYNQNTADTKTASNYTLLIEYLNNPSHPDYIMRIHTDKDDGKFIDVNPEWMQAACEKIKAMEKL